MTTIFVKKISANDVNYVENLLNKKHLEFYSNILINILMREIVIQGTIFLSAILYIVLGVPLYLCWLSVILVILIVLAAVFIEFRKQKSGRKIIMDSLEETYLINNKTGFWLALATDERVVKPVQVKELNTNISCNESEMHTVGMIGVRLKYDPDQREPPESVGEIDNLFVMPSYRGCGVGEELVNIVVGHCDTVRLRAMEMTVNIVEEGARKLCERLDWNMEIMNFRTVLGVLKTEQYLYRKPCNFEKK